MLWMAPSSSVSMSISTSVTGIGKLLSYFIVDALIFVRYATVAVS